MKRLEKLFKRLLVSIARLIFSPKQMDTRLINWHKFRKILVFRLDERLGNAILLIPLLQSIRKSLPTAQIDVLSAARYCSVYENHPAVSQIIAYDQKNLLKNPPRLIRFIQNMRHYNYDVVFSVTNPNAFSLSQACMSLLIAKKKSVGFNAGEAKRFYTDVVIGRTTVFYAEALLDLWRYYDPSTKYTKPLFFFVDQKQLMKSGEGVLIWLGATGQKILPKELIQELSEILKKMNIDFCFALGPGDKDLIERYSLDRHQTVHILSGSILETAKFFTKFEVLIMPDTGPAHLAAGLGLPLVQIFVGSDPAWYGYYGDRNLVLNKQIDTGKFEQFIERHVRKIPVVHQPEAG